MSSINLHLSQELSPCFATIWQQNFKYPHTLFKTLLRIYCGKAKRLRSTSAFIRRGVLHGDGFEQADTVAVLFVNSKAQEKLHDGVLWVDEAGLLGLKDMTALLELRHKKNKLLIIGGDTLQHSSVDRVDALRILNTVGKIKTAEVSKIYRQKKRITAKR